MVLMGNMVFRNMNVFFDHGVKANAYQKTFHIAIVQDVHAHFSLI